jgi:hypothetical protein
MAVREWRIESPIPHEVIMEHGWISGRVRVFVDGKLGYERPRKVVDCGFAFQFSIDDHMFVVSALPSITKCFSYSLRQLERTDQIVDLVPIVLTRSEWIRDTGFYCGAWLAALAVTVLLWACVAADERARLTPKSNDISLRGFAASMSPPHALAVVEDAASSKIVWVGETAMWSLPSGPACYVFDSKGTLVEWDVSTGDGEPTTRFMRRAFDGKQLTVDEALEFVDAVDAK